MNTIAKLFRATLTGTSRTFLTGALCGAVLTAAGGAVWWKLSQPAAEDSYDDLFVPHAANMADPLDKISTPFNKKYLVPESKEPDAASSIPNDCWSGVMAPEKAPHGQLVARGPVEQWRVGMPLVLYPTKEDYAQIIALAGKGQTGTFDTSRPITVIPTWISGPEPEGSGEDKSIQVMMKYRSAQGETGAIVLTYSTPMSGHRTSLPPDQKATIAKVGQQLHDITCRGIP
jgi:hypothetical protein